ncbi:MAG: hypothetical protein CL928_00555, partial [Deltaproteobacteria bacterium]|nr:hypothetical protein [Deltaproteobacteria bacterium]
MTGTSTAPERVAEFLRGIPLFRPLSETLRNEIATSATPVDLAGGEWLFRAGEPGDSLYVLHLGLVEVVDESQSPPVVLRVLGRGQSFGELALLNDAPRSASIRALRDCSLLRIDRDDYEALLLRNPRVILETAKELVHRLQNPGSSDHRSGSYLGVLTIASVGVPLRHSGLTDRIVANLSAGLKVSCLDGSELEPARDDEQDLDAAYRKLLDESERDNDLVLLVVDSEAGVGGPQAAERWRNFSMRQGDRVLLVVDPATKPEHSPLEHRPNGVDVAFVCDEHRAQSLGPWLDALQPRAHHFLHPLGAIERDVGRMCRRLVGASIGVVLCGGGARALAHIGVLQALEEADLQVDRIGGVSMGALLSALYASGRSIDEMVAICQRELVERNPFNDYTFPMVSLIRAHKAERMLRGVFGAADIESLPMPYFCVSSDLLSATVHVHRRGPLVESIGASMSLPGVAPPRRMNGGLLVDGGVLNNLPTDVGRAAQEGPVIGCDLLSAS